MCSKRSEHLQNPPTLSKQDPRSDAEVETIVRGTVYDTELMEDYIPLQYWQEFVAGRDAIRKHQTLNQSFAIYIFIRARESVLPLTSLMVWAKAAQLLATSKSDIKINVKRVISGTNRSSIDIEKIIDIGSAFGFSDEPATISQLKQQIDLDSEMGPVTASVYRKTRTSLLDRMNGEELNDVLDVISLVSFCCLKSHRFVLCGQNQARLLNSLWHELRYAKDQERTTPIGLFLPNMPFAPADYPLAEDSEDIVRKKLGRTLLTFTGRRQQIQWASDLIRLTLGTWPNTVELKPVTQETDNLDVLAGGLAQDIYNWMQIPSQQIPSQ